MTKQEQLAIKFELVLAEAQAIYIEVKAMEADNQERLCNKERIAWTGEDFRNKSLEVRKIASQIRSLNY